MGQTYFNGLFLTNNDGRDLETAVLHTCRQLRNVSCSPGIEALALGSTSHITPHRRWTVATPAAARPLVDAEVADRRWRVRTVRVFDRLCRHHQARRGAS